ncbi:MAG: hypothetical protein IJ877_01465 [Candidatus Gastranaerophilales bacterium]|nr:hypothetical protein [Candidatus Gastranaerophilales bacterium]
MYAKIGDTAYISGQFGKYDGLIQNPSARFGRNAIANHIEYLQEYHHDPVECQPFEEGDTFERQMEKVDKFVEDLKKAQEKMPPINFKLRYMPNVEQGHVDYNALMGAAYEEMGQKFAVNADSLYDKLNPENQDIEINSYALDINHDGKVDIGEYSSSILLADALSTNEEKLDIQNIDGTITNKGENAMLRDYGNTNIAYQAYSYLYHFYNLGTAAKEFAQSPNNTIALVDFSGN